MSPLPRIISSTSEPRSRSRQPRVARLAEHDAGDVPPPREVEHRVGDAEPGEPHHLRRRATRRAAGAPRAAGGPRRRAAAGSSPRPPPRTRARGARPRCGGRPDEPRRSRARARRRRGRAPPWPRRARRRARSRNARTSASTRSAIRRSASSRSASRLPRSKKCSRATRRLLGQVDLPFAEPLEQLLGRDVDELDLVGALEHRVRHRLAHLDAGDLRDHVVQALDVLDVERGVDLDARVEQLEHVLPALGVARARARSCARARRGAGSSADARARRRGRTPRGRGPRYGSARRGSTSSPSMSPAVS